MIVSVGVIFVASVADPFSVPFQDWDQMPEEQKQMYVQKSQTCSYAKYIGISGLLVGLVGGALSLKKKKTET